MGGPISTHALKYLQHRRDLGQIKAVSARNMRWVLLGFGEAMGDRSLKQVGVGDIERWAAAHAHLSPGTQRLRWSIVRQYLNWCVERGHIKKNPMNGIKAPKVPRAVHRALTREQTVALFAACSDNRDRLIVELGLQCGLRRAELAGLEVGDVDFRERVIFVREGKGGHQREIGLTGAAVVAIRAYLADARWISSGPLIQYYGPRHRHKHVQPKWVGAQVRRICWDAGIKSAPYDGVSTHALRHTAATDVYDEHQDLLVVQDLLGHSGTGNLSRYVRRRSVARLREAMEGRDYHSPGEAAG